MSGDCSLRIALVADIHSNLLALEAVMEAMKKKDVQRILNAGDIVGYGPRPNEVIDLVRRSDFRSIRGNHDHAVLVGEYGWFNESAAAAAKWTADIIGDSNLEYLDRLKREEVIKIDGKSIGMFHGSPEDPDEYVFDESRAEELLRKTAYDVIICGHTHSPMKVRIGKRLLSIQAPSGSRGTATPMPPFRFSIWTRWRARSSGSATMYLLSGKICSKRDCLALSHRVFPKGTEDTIII